MKKRLERGREVLIVILLALALFGISYASSQPSGADVNEGSSQRAPADAPESVAAQAGNVTELNIFGYTVTQSWQGYFGNVTGTIQLADGSDNVFYNWSAISPQGEIFSSANSTINWANIQCFNFTATGTMNSSGETPGGTSLNGTNLSQLEALYNIEEGDVDGVDETFVLKDHDGFYVSSLQFSANECVSTRIYGDTGAGVDQEFEEVILYDPVTTSVVFTSLLEQDLLGFDQRTHDFQMLVLEDGHGTDTEVTPYYFFVELE